MILFNLICLLRRIIVQQVKLNDYEKYELNHLCQMAFTDSAKVTKEAIFRINSRILADISPKATPSFFKKFISFLEISFDLAEKSLSYIDHILILNEFVQGNSNLISQFQLTYPKNHVAFHKFVESQILGKKGAKISKISGISGTVEIATFNNQNKQLDDKDKLLNKLQSHFSEAEIASIKNVFIF